MARLALATVPARHPGYTVALAALAVTLVRLAAIRVAVAGLALAVGLFWVAVVAVGAPFTSGAGIAVLTLATKHAARFPYTTAATANGLKNTTFVKKSAAKIII